MSQSVNPGEKPADSEAAADAVEPDHNSTDDQTTLESANAAAGTTGATSGIIETAGAHAPVLDEATPDITDEGDQTDLSRKTFADFGVEPEICEALDAKGITHPFPIQALTLPVALEGQDIIGQAKTGTGKTLGFGIPVLEDVIAPDEEGYEDLLNPNKPQALIILPTRELTKQVAQDLREAAKYLSTRIVEIYGGVAFEPQIEAFRAQAVTSIIEAGTAEGRPDEWDLDALWGELGRLYPVGLTQDEIVEALACRALTG